jgi:hypothetical protein
LSKQDIAEDAGIFLHLPFQFDVSDKFCYQKHRSLGRRPWKLKLETKFARKIGDHDHYVTPWWCSPALLS